MFVKKDLRPQPKEAGAVRTGAVSSRFPSRVNGMIVLARGMTL